MALQEVKGTIRKPNGQAWIGGTIVFELISSPFIVGVDTYPKWELQVATGGDGTFSADLVVPEDPDLTSSFRVTLPNGDRFHFPLSQQEDPVDISTLYAAAGVAAVYDNSAVLMLLGQLETAVRLSGLNAAEMAAEHGNALRLVHAPVGESVILYDGLPEEVDTGKASAFAYQAFLAALSDVTLSAQGDTTTLTDALGQPTSLYRLGRLYWVLKALIGATGDTAFVPDLNGVSTGLFSAMRILNRVQAMLEQAAGAVVGLDGTGTLVAKSALQYLTEITALRDQASASATSAAASSAAAATAGNLYPDEPTGRAAVANGQYFRVGDAQGYYLYIRTGPSASTLINYLAAEGSNQRLIMAFEAGAFRWNGAPVREAVSRRVTSGNVVWWDGSAGVFTGTLSGYAYTQIVITHVNSGKTITGTVTTDSYTFMRFSNVVVT